MQERVQILKRIIDEFGISIIDDHRKCEAVLRDLCPDDDREVFILSSALKKGVPSALLAAQIDGTQQLMIINLSARLESELGFSKASSAWAVQTWAKSIDRKLSASETKNQGSLNNPRPPISGSTIKPALISKVESINSNSLVVSCDGSTRYAVINEAVKDAEAGSTIYIKPGVYIENIILDKPIEIKSNYASEDVVIVPLRNTPIITVQSSAVVLSGISLRSKGLKEQNQVALLVKNGKIEINNCIISANYSYGILISDERSEAKIIKTEITDSFCGVRVNSGAKVHLKGCSIKDNISSGLVVTDSSSALITGSRIQNCEIGLFINNQSKVIIDNSDIDHSKDSSILVTNNGDVQISKSNIHSSKNGMLFMERAHGVVAKSNFWSNTCAVFAKEYSSITMENCDISGSASSEVIVIESKAQAKFNECKIVGKIGKQIFSKVKLEKCLLCQ